ncbi:MAG: transcriptional regulator [Anaerocolumna sp.]|jgi:transcriptional regulator with XRE-family HTH domain|nr:transcriptional regulator [Anaerocolumna sp.]
MSFGNNLEKIRKEHKISQSKLGCALGITQQMISSYEKNISSPNIESLIRLADYFHVSVDELIGHTVLASNDDKSSKAKFDCLFDSLTTEDKARCLVILQTLLIDRSEALEKK